MVETRSTAAVVAFFTATRARGAGQAGPAAEAGGPGELAQQRIPLRLHRGQTREVCPLLGFVHPVVGPPSGR